MTGSKWETRRLGWRGLKRGTHLLGVYKSQGRRNGEPIKKLAEIEVVNVWREPICACDPKTVFMEGINATPQEFVEHFVKMARCEAGTEVTVIQFDYVRWFYDPPLAVGEEVRVPTLHARPVRLRFHYGTVIDTQGQFVKIEYNNPRMRPNWTHQELCALTPESKRLTGNRFDAEVKRQRERNDERARDTSDRERGNQPDGVRGKQRLPEGGDVRTTDAKEPARRAGDAVADSKPDAPF